MAYEVKELANELKAKGLDLAEDAVMNALEAIESWAEKSAKQGTKPIVDGVVLAVAPMLVKLAKEQADKIDGQVG